MKKTFIGFSIAIGAISVLLILFLATGLWKFFFYPEEEEFVRTRIVTPRETTIHSASGQSGQVTWNQNVITRIPLNDDEIVIAVLNKESEEGLAEEQFAVYYIESQTGPVHITFIGFDETSRSYKRIWDMPAAAVHPETISLFSQDLIGDRNNCIIVTGMNAQNEHTMTIFRRIIGQQAHSYKKIAELQIAGSIVIQDIQRSLAYQQGIARGASRNIATYGHDTRSENILDQIETIYSYNPVSQQYEQTNVTRIPGSQIEQRRIRELISGGPAAFEEFSRGLWYFVSPQGTIDTRQYLYFDPTGREIIFFGDGAQQIFRWQTSSPSRLGIYIRSQNLSISTLLRFINLELESLDSIKITVNEDVRLKIQVSTTWDGTYRRATTAAPQRQLSKTPWITDALFDSTWGRMQFSDTGEYTINSSGVVRKGRYLFFNVDGNDLLELRPEEIDSSSESRMVFKVENSAGNRILSRVRLGTAGIQYLLEPPITLTPVIN